MKPEQVREEFNDPKNVIGEYEWKQFFPLVKEWHDELSDRDLYETYIGLARFLYFAKVRLRLLTQEAASAQLAEREKEVTDGFDAIFPHVPQANDDAGNQLTLAGKIEILGKELIAAEARNRALEEVMRDLLDISEPNCMDENCKHPRHIEKILIRKLAERLLSAKQPDGSALAVPIQPGEFQREDGSRFPPKRKQPDGESGFLDCPKCGYYFQFPGPADILAAPNVCPNDGMVLVKREDSHQ